MPNKAKLASQGKAIMSEAKKIRQAHPNMKWQKAVAEAAKKLKK